MIIPAYSVSLMIHGSCRESSIPIGFNGSRPSDSDEVCCPFLPMAACSLFWDGSSQTSAYKINGLC